MHNCSRTACQKPILGRGFRIENDSSVRGRLYCHECGERITSYDKRSVDPLKLVYEEFETDHDGNIKAGDGVAAGSEGSDGSGAS